MLRKLAKSLHDRVFANRPYRLRVGYFRGYLRRGRMPWLQKPPDAKVQQEIAFFESLSLQTATVYDIGAAEGAHTCLFHRLVGPQGRVIAFEPEPASFARLEDVITLNELAGVTAFAVGLGEQPGRFTVVVPDSERVALAPTMAPLLQAVLDESLVLARVEVEVARLDDWVSAQGLSDPALMKIDVEGFEIPVLLGARELLHRARPLLFIEIHGADDAQKYANAKGVIDILAPLGYRFRHLETSRAVPAEQPQLALRGHLIAFANEKLTATTPKGP